MTDEKRKARAGIFVVAVEDRHLFALVAVLLVIVIGALAAFVFAQSKVNGRVSKNANEISDNATRIDRQEIRDVVRLRRADARLCARENLVRAEVHVAYQQPPLPAPPGEPILKALLDQAGIVQQRGLKRVRKNLPILECAPNLKGKAAFPLSARKQKRFVELYVHGRLSAVPTAGDAESGPDE